VICIPSIVLGVKKWISKS